MAQRMGNPGKMWQILDIGVPSAWLHRISKQKETCKAWMSLYVFFFCLFVFASFPQYLSVHLQCGHLRGQAQIPTVCYYINGITFKTQIVVVYVQR